MAACLTGDAGVAADGAGGGLQRELLRGDSVPRLMVMQPGATCPGSPGGATAGLGQVRHRVVRGVELAGGIGYGASAERLRDRSPPTVSTVGFSAQELAAESGAALRDSGGTGGCV